MHLRKFIKLKLQESLNNVDEKIKDIIMSGYEFDSFTTALEIKFGNTVPLFHATSEEKAAIIDQEGLKLTFGKNYKSFAHEENLYFQIGHSDYQDSYRSVIYKWDAPIDFISSYAEADMDNVTITGEDLQKLGIDIDNISSDMRDVISYFVWNNYSLDGMELLITNRNNDSDFPVIHPTRIN